jgi:hypothetical protein
MKKTTTTGIIIATGLLTALAPLHGADAPPPDPWARVPVNIHFGKRDDNMTDAEIEFLAKNSVMVTLEKGHGASAHGSTEAGVADTARRIKQRNPSVKVLFYLNAFINWGGYEAHKTYRPEWTLRRADGEIVKHRSGTLRPDPSNAAFREWWSDVIANEMKRGPIDGVFVDALPQALGSSLANSGVDDKKVKEVIAGLREMIDLTKRKIGKDKILLVNGTRATNYREILDWEGIDGVMIEHFAAFNSAQPAAIRADLETIALAAAKGKFVVLKGWPDFNWIDTEMMKRPNEELLKLAREQITFPLACFLVAARPGSLFCYSWGYTERHGTLESYPEFQRPLGAPLGEARQTGWSYQRDFAHASVSVDFQTKKARINWKP